MIPFGAALGFAFMGMVWGLFIGYMWGRLAERHAP